MQNKSKSTWINYIRRRIEKNKNFLAFYSGQTGSGKSWSCLATGELLDEEFGIDRVVFDAREFMALINSGKLKKGSVIVWDEMSVTQDAKTWQSLMNRLIANLIQTFRHRNFILLMNSPYMRRIDYSTRMLFHAKFQTINIDYKTNSVKVKPMSLQYNEETGKIYQKYLRKRKEGLLVPVERWKIPKPSEELIIQYEAKRKAFTDKLNKEIEKQIAELYGENQDELTEIEQFTLEKLKLGFLPDDIAIMRGRQQRVVYDTMKRLKEKGYNIHPIHEIGGSNRIKRYDVSQKHEKTENLQNLNMQSPLII